MAALSEAVGFEAAVRALRDSLKVSDPSIFKSWTNDQFRRYLVQYMATAKQYGAGVSLNPLPGKPSFSAFAASLQNGLGAPAETAKRFLAAIIRLQAAGSLSFEVFSPMLTETRVAEEKAKAAQDPGFFDRLKASADKAGAIVEYLPWILGGTAVVVVVFVGLPYLQAARAPARAATKAARRLA